MKSKRIYPTGYLVNMFTNDGKRYRYGVRKKYLEAFIISAFNHNCTVEFVDFYKMPRNSGIIVIDDEE